MLVPKRPIRGGFAPSRFCDERQHVVEHVLLGRDLGIEFQADFVRPPTALRLRANHRQAVSVELLDERGLVVQAVQMHAMQVQHHVAVRIAAGRDEQVAGVAGDGFGGPGSEGSHKDNVLWSIEWPMTNLQ